MAREAGLDRTSTGQLNTTARSGGIARQINGVGVDVNGVVYVDSMATTTAPSTLVNAGLRVTSDGAICVTTTDPGNTRMRNGMKLSAAGELFASNTAPVSTAVRTFDPLLGSILVSANGAIHVTVATFGMTVLDSDGNSFSAAAAVLDADGNSFTVTNAVLDADGNSFTVT